MPELIGKYKHFDYIRKGKIKAMFYCNDCKEYFDEDEERSYRVEVEYHGEFGSEAPVFPDAMAYRVCPYCGSEDLEEAEECGLCGEFFHTNDDVCPECQDVISKRFKTFLDDTFFELGRGDTLNGRDCIKDVIADLL